MNTSEIQDALRAKFSPPAYAILFEVRNGTGFARNPSTADVLVMSTWPSRGLELIGIEIKASRGDWLRELKQPAKADPIFQFCDRWYLVIKNIDIVQPGELPPTWGLMGPAKHKIQIIREAPMLVPKPIDRLMLAAIMRAACDPQRTSIEAQRLLQQKEQEFEKRLGQAIEQDRRNHDAELRRLQNMVMEFEDASGVKLNPWDGGRIGEAVKTVLHSDLSNIQREVRSLHTRLGKIVEEIGLCHGASTKQS